MVQSLQPVQGHNIITNEKHLFKAGSSIKNSNLDKFEIDNSPNAGSPERMNFITAPLTNCDILLVQQYIHKAYKDNNGEWNTWKRQDVANVVCLWTLHNLSFC